MKTSTTPVKSIKVHSTQDQAHQQQECALNIVGSGSSNNYDGIITLSFENSSNNNNNNANSDNINNKNSSDISVVNSYNNTANGINNVIENLNDTNKSNCNNGSSEIVIEIGDKSRVPFNSGKDSMVPQYQHCLLYTS